MLINIYCWSVNASVNSSSAHPSPGAYPRALAFCFFFKKIGKSLRVGIHELSKCPGMGMKEEVE